MRRLSHIARQLHTTLLMPERRKKEHINININRWLADSKSKCNYQTNLLEWISHGWSINLRFNGWNNRQYRIKYSWPGFYSGQEILVKWWICSQCYKSNLWRQTENHEYLIWCQVISLQILLKGINCTRLVLNNLISSISQSGVFCRHVRNQNRKLTKVSKVKNPSVESSPVTVNKKNYTTD